MGNHLRQSGRRSGKEELVSHERLVGRRARHGPCRRVERGDRQGAEIGKGRSAAREARLNVRRNGFHKFILGEAIALAAAIVEQVRTWKSG